MKYWNPLEPNTLRYPKPEGVVSFEVPDDFDVETAAELGGALVVDPVKVAAKNSRIAAEAAAKAQLATDRSARLAKLANIDAVNTLPEMKDAIKTILQELRLI